MKCSLHWLNQYLTEPVDAQTAMDLLDRQGFPVEETEEIGESDLMLDVEVTSNRGDCLSHVGAAREIAAGSAASLKLPDCSLPGEGSTSVNELTTVANEAEDICPVYTARVIKGVTVGPSPDWLVKCIEAIGLRSVNNVVDVTNYVLFESGQPLHAFDLAKLDGQRIVVRRAKKGEKFVAIDSTTHELDDQMLVIADASKPVAVAGVMGGLDSEVGEQTTDVLLESARFIPLSVRTTSRKLKLSSDSSYRFERGVDPRGVEIASMRAARLIVELAGGELAEGVIRVGEAEPEPRQVEMRIERCRSLLGYDIDHGKMVQLLDSLELAPSLDEAAGKINCAVPTFRGDIEREVDLIEEVARMHGLADIEVADRISIRAQAPKPRIVARQKLGSVMTAHGYNETITFSFLSPQYGKPFLESGCEPLLIGDERRKAEPMLRPSVLPSLLSCRKSNQDVGNEAVKLFEVASTWQRKEGAILEKRRFGLFTDAVDAQLALRELRGSIEELITTLTGSSNIVVKEGDWGICDVAATVAVDGQVIGSYGLLSAKLQKAFDLQTPAIVGEFDVETLLEQYPPQNDLQELSRYPGIERDLSVIVSEDIVWAQLEQAVVQVQPEFMESLAFITTYRGKPIEKGAKSVSFRMTFRDPDATLRHEQVDPQVNQIVDQLKKSLNAELRT